MIHQIWFDLGKGNVPLEPNGIESMKNYCENNNLEYKLWSYKEADDIIDNMSSIIQHIWKSLPHAITKIDFFRYVLMYKFGGMYFDIDFHCIKGLNNLQIQDCCFLCEEWPFSFQSGSLHNGVLLCKSPNHPFWIDVFSEIEKRLGALATSEIFDIQKSVFKLTGTAMLRDVAHSYIHHRRSLLGHSIIIMPYGVFCPLVSHDRNQDGSQDGTYIDSYDRYDEFKRIGLTQTWSVPSKQIIYQHARNFTSGFLGASVKVWQHKFKSTL